MMNYVVFVNYTNDTLLNTVLHRLMLVSLNKTLQNRCVAAGLLLNQNMWTGAKYYNTTSIE